MLATGSAARENQRQNRYGADCEDIAMMMKLFLPVMAACSLMISSASAQPAAGNGKNITGKSIALAFQEKQALDLKVRAALAAPGPQMQEICGANTDNAREWAYRFAARSFAILSDSIKPEKADMPFVDQLARAYYGRSRIYYAAGSRPMRDKELNGRITGNDRMIDGIMQAARHSLGSLPDSRALKQEAEAKIAALIAPDNPASACN